MLLAGLYVAYNGGEREECTLSLCVEGDVCSVKCVRVLFDIWFDALVVFRAPPCIALRRTRVTIDIVLHPEGRSIKKAPPWIPYRYSSSGALLIG